MQGRWLGLGLAFACSAPEGPRSRALSSSPAPAPVAPPTTPPYTADLGPVTCDREPDFREWDGGMTLRLDAGDVPEPPGEVLLEVSGAVPGETLEFHLGDFCALDCPPTLDGACFQPVRATVLGTADADADGRAALLVPVTDAWAEKWFVLQVTAPDRRALSQPLVDRVSPDLSAWWPLGQEAVEVSYATIRGLFLEDSAEWTAYWPLDPGRTVQVRHTTTSFTGFYYDYETDLERVAGGERTWIGGSVDPVAPETALYDVAIDQPATLALEVYYDYSAAYFDLDLAPGPSAEQTWYPDRDADGFGDPNAAPVLAATRPPLTTTDASDCDDADPSVSPYGLEACGDGVDQDCDGVDRACAFSGASAVEGTIWRGAPYEHLSGFALGEVAGDRVWAASGERSGLGAPTPVDAVPLPLGLTSDGVAIGDGDGDGLGDLALAGEDEVVLLSHGDPTQVVASWEGGRYTLLPVFGDVTGDGQLDLLWAMDGGSDAHTEIRVGPLSSTSPALTVPHVAGWTRANLAVGESTGDGIVDLWTEDGCWHASPALDPGICPLGEDVLTIRTADFDGDGLDDAALANRDDVFLLSAPSWTESGRISGHSTDIAWTPTRDGDPLPELIVATPDGVWQLAPSAGVVDVASGVALGPVDADAVFGGDLDEDGFGEVIVGLREQDIGRTPEAGTFTVWWGP